ncbi:MAG: hypothetical protein ACOCV1_01600 [Bacillota bacterium]
MALKDWKKTVDERSELEFRNKKTGDIISFDKATSQDLRYMIWDFYINKKQQIESFKTKSEALKYAKSYMEKH